MSSPRQLIVNADDFGLSPGVNRGIIRAHEDGIVTSTSLMVRWPGAVEAAAYALAHPGLAVGLHLDLGEWRCVGEEWQQAYEVVSLDDRGAIASEVARQLAAFNKLVGRPPTHLDSHQHVHRHEPVLSIVRLEAEKLGTVLRGFNSEVCYCGAFYGQSNKGHPWLEGISVNTILELLRNLPEGTTELGCHPGDDPSLDSVYRNERLIECETLCDPRVRAALADLGIHHCSFLNWRRQGGGS